jgi:hypothetical protein
MLMRIDSVGFKKTNRRLGGDADRKGRRIQSAVGFSAAPWCVTRRRATNGNIVQGAFTPVREKMLGFHFDRANHGHRGSLCRISLNLVAPKRQEKGNLYEGALPGCVSVSK